MRIFVIHLSKQTCLKYGLRERNAEPLLESLQNPKHPVEVFDAIYAKISKGLHPLVQQHAHPYFVHTSVRQDLVGRVCGGGGVSACFYALKYEARVLSAGELGAYASHYSLWQKCIQLDEPIVILEDDIYLEPYFFESLDFLQEHIAKIGYIRLSHNTHHKICKRPTKFPHIFEVVQFTLGIGTMGYCLTPKVAHKFIQASQKWVMPVDWVMDNHCLHGVRNLVFEPFIIGENEQAMQSSIDRPPSTQKVSPLVWLCNKIAHFRFELYFWSYAKMRVG
ncbi:glycosyltransferase family 25 protein [Helicobacter mehlei]|uniref:glycosyltransferase family 25 protein n=1 Tax=Helicobacter mehlei TaxID=2316080 RepID=UPI000EB366CC|nr:glycosyltransferase family 25 protein [Helicobacter mehlei]